MKKIVILSFILLQFFCSKKKDYSYTARLEKITNFAIENTSTGILSMNINSVAIDKYNNLWVGSQNGFGVHKDNQWHNYYQEYAYSEVVSDYDGDIWILMKNCVKKWMGTTFVDFKIEPDTAYVLYNSMTKEKNGKLWFSTRGDGLFSFYHNHWQHYTTKDGLPGDTIDAIVYDKKNKLVWAGTNRGVAYFQNSKWHRVALIDTDKKREPIIISELKNKPYNESTTHIFYPPGVYPKTTSPYEQYPSIREIKIDDRGRIWVLTKSNELWFYEKGIWNQHVIGSRIFNLNHFFVYIKNNVILLGGSGLYRLTGNSIETLLPRINVTVMMNAQDHFVWVGTYKHGLIKLNIDSQEYVSFTPEGGILSNNVLDLLIDHNDNTLVATDKGLAMFDGKKWTTIDFGLKVYAVIEDNHTQYWILTSNGLKMMEGRDILKIPCPHRIPQWYQATIAADSARTILAGGNIDGRGVYVYDGDTWSICNKDSGLSDNNINAIFIDDKSRRWIGTDNGLVMIKGKELKIYCVEDGLSGNKITAIEQDNRGDLWIGTIRGLNRFDGKNFTNSLLNKRITRIKKGKYNDMWVGVLNDRLWRVDICSYPDKSSLTPFPKDRISFQVHALAIDSEGNVWTGTSYLGIKKLAFNYESSKQTAQKTVKKEELEELMHSVQTTPSSSEGEWSTIFHNFARTNTSFNQKIKPPLALDWKISIGPISYSAPLYSSPIVSEGKLYVADHEGIVWCVDAATGSKLWSNIIGPRSHRIPMALVDHQLIVQGEDNNLNFFSQKNGKKIGELNIMLSDIIVKDGKIYGVSDEGIIIIDVTKRKIVSKIPVKKCRYISASDDYFVVAGSFSLIAYTFKDHKKVWEKEKGARPIIYKDRVICISSIMSCYELKTERNLWNINIEGMCFSHPAVWSDRIYAQYAPDTNSVKLMCFDVNNGDFLWEKSIHGLKGISARFSGTYPPVVCNGIVYVIATPRLYAFDALSGKIIWQEAIAGHLTAPIVVGSERIFITALGEIFGLKTLKLGKYTPEEKEPTIVHVDKEKLLTDVESNIDSIKKKANLKVKRWIAKFDELAFKFSRDGGEWNTCHKLMDSLAQKKQVDVIALFIKKESLISWTISSTQNAVMTTLKGVLKDSPNFAELIYPSLVQFIEQDDNLTLKRKAVYLLGYIDDRHAVTLLKSLLKEHSVMREVIHALCVQPQDASYRVLDDFLSNEANNKYWTNAVQGIYMYKAHERFTSILRYVAGSDWSDSLTKDYAIKALKKIEDEKHYRVEGPSAEIISEPVESLSCADLENFVARLYRSGNYIETYEYSIFGLGEFPRSETLLYYKGVSAYYIGEIDIGIETLILLIEKSQNFPQNETIREILFDDALKRPKYKNKENLILNYFDKQVE